MSNMNLSQSLTNKEQQRLKAEERTQTAQKCESPPKPYPPSASDVTFSCESLAVSAACLRRTRTSHRRPSPSLSVPSVQGSPSPSPISLSRDTLPVHRSVSRILD
ncbi:hypothetical protein PIB30_070830 [Stylosanthes scabra]|uniref:Uncharacterized protein n=1 Tax=Stylosanthes scabra TaxID=79078 RepID=A0ABU6YN04_9FABA|nr:hypothetical protein [Stylosanthes scabra]